MKKITLTSLMLLTCITHVFSQNHTQTVRGAIQDADSKLPLIGAAFQQSLLLLNQWVIVRFKV